MIQETFIYTGCSVGQCGTCKFLIVHKPEKVWDVVQEVSYLFEKKGVKNKIKSQGPPKSHISCNADEGKAAYSTYAMTEVIIIIILYLQP